MRFPEFNAKSVALEVTKKDFSENRKMFDKKVAALELALVKFSEFKDEQKADDKKRKKTKKKAKQKLKKEQLARGMYNEELDVYDAERCLVILWLAVTYQKALLGLKVRKGYSGKDTTDEEIFDQDSDDAASVSLDERCT